MDSCWLFRRTNAITTTVPAIVVTVAEACFILIVSHRWYDRVPMSPPIVHLYDLLVVIHQLLILLGRYHLEALVVALIVQNE
uniref:Uncharacterized protein n=1 Tax=Anopheles darlingi TaxID=43151 RepID=A0A2M4DNF4_ANODA